MKKLQKETQFIPLIHKIIIMSAVYSVDYPDLAGVSNGKAYDIGVSFASGPATYSLTYFNGEGLGAVSEQSSVVLAARYAVSSNFAVGVSISDTTSDLAGVEVFDGQLLALGASFSF